jgi:penicillin-binding protein 1A
VRVLGIIGALGRLGFWLLRQVLGIGRARPSQSLPSPFQSVAAQAFRADEKPETALPRAPASGKWFGRLKLRYRIAFALTAAALVGLATTFAGMTVYYTIAFPNPLAIRKSENAPIIRILARDGSVLAERGAAHAYMPLDQLPKVIPAAVVATEDRRFFDHYGVDPVGMIRAMFANLRAGRFAQGGSTLTQQLAKNLFLTQDRTLTRKVAELGLALWLEMRLTKPEILELYLNQVYFGGGAYGIEAASQRYFGKPARQLTLAEAALIAGLLKAPSRYSPATSPGAARARGRVVLGRMVDAGFITPEDETRAAAEPLVFSEAKEPKTANDAGYVVDYVLDQLPPMIGEGHAELIVETTLDKNLQRRAQQIVNDSLGKRGGALGASQGAVVVLDGEGAIRALVGGRDYGESQFDRAVKARRQPGSAFKPFVYLAALEHGMTTETVMTDQPITIGAWSPKNDNGQYAGAVTLRRALAQSLNTVAVRLNQDVGSGRTIEVAQRLGIKSELHDGPALALGTSEVTLLEMTGAYAAFSNGGKAVEPHVVTRVRTSSGHVLYESAPARGARVIDEARVGAMNDMLNAVVVYGTGKRAALPDQPVAGKTGTTQDFRDAWFVGYTSHLTAGVWIGNDNGKPMNRATGGSLPAEIWNQVMRVAHEGEPALPLPGTVLNVPSAEAAAEYGDVQHGPAFSGPRAPRVVQAPVREELPWLAALRGIKQAAPVSAAPAVSVPTVPVAVKVGTAETAPVNAPTAPTVPGFAHPAESIGEDFISEAIADTAEPASANIARSAIAKPNSQ